MLKISQVSKSYGKKQILDKIEFAVEPGRIIGLVGENGAGKSTLLSILATLQKPTNGDIHLFNLNYKKDKKEIRKQIGFVPQDIAVWEELSVRDNMKFFEELSWVKKSELELKQLCLEMKLEKWHEPVKTLSGGMKRKLNLAISFIHEPALLLLDEPTAGIDLKSRMEIGEYLKIQATEKQKMIIYTSHDMEEIRSLCDTVVCIGNDPFYKNILHKDKKPIISF